MISKFKVSNWGPWSTDKEVCMNLSYRYDGKSEIKFTPTSFGEKLEDVNKFTIIMGAMAQGKKQMFNAMKFAFRFMWTEVFDSYAFNPNDKEEETYFEVQGLYYHEVINNLESFRLPVQFKICMAFNPDHKRKMKIITSDPVHKIHTWLDMKDFEEEIPMYFPEEDKEPELFNLIVDLMNSLHSDVLFIEPRPTPFGRIYDGAPCFNWPVPNKPYDPDYDDYLQWEDFKDFLERMDIRYLDSEFNSYQFTEYPLVRKMSWFYFILARKSINQTIIIFDPFEGLHVKLGEHLIQQIRNRELDKSVNQIIAFTHRDYPLDTMSRNGAVETMIISKKHGLRTRQDLYYKYIKPAGMEYYTTSMVDLWYKGMFEDIPKPDTNIQEDILKSNEEGGEKNGPADISDNSENGKDNE